MSTDKAVTPPADDAPAGADKAYALDFKTREETERGFKEVQAAKTRAEQRAAELEKKLRESEVQAEVSRQLQDEAKRNAAANGTSVEEEVDKLSKEWSTMTNEWADPAKALLDLGHRVGGEARKTIDAKTSELQKKIEALESQLTEVQVTQSPLYQQNRKYIDSLVTTLGCSRKMAIEAFEKLAEDGVATIQAAPPPGDTVGSRPTGTNGQKLRKLTPEERAQLKRLDPNLWTEAELDAERMEV